MITNIEDTSASSGDDSQAEIVEKKRATLLARKEATDDISLPEDSEITREQLSLGKRIFNWRTIVPLMIVVIALVIFAQKANIDPKKTWEAMRSANMLFFLAAFLVYYLSFLIRALRWKMLLENVGFSEANGIRLPRYWKIVEIIYISFFANVIVPAKLGDLYRAYLLRQETGVSATRSYGTVLAERLLDLIILLLLCIPAVLISLHEKLPWQVELGLGITLAGVIVGVIGLFALRIFHLHIEKLVPLRFRTHYNHLHAGMLGSFRRLPALTTLTVATWACEALRFFFVAMALNLIQGSILHMVAAAFFIGLVEALLTVIPFTGGGVGLVEGGMVAMIALFNQNTTSLVPAAILLDRTISLFSIIVIGLVIFMIAFGRQTAKQAQKA